MRIAFILSLFPRLSETFILNQITGLIDRGHEIDIYAYGSSIDSQLHSDIINYDLLERTYYFGNLMPKNKLSRLMKALYLITKNFSKNHRPILKSLNIFKFGKEAASLRLLYKVIPFLNKSQYDIIQCHFGPNGNLGVLLKMVCDFKGKLITTFHGYDIRLGLEKGGKIYRRLFDKGDLFIAISSYNYRNLINLGLNENKIVYHPVGINLNIFVNKWQKLQDIAKSSVKIITVARLVKEKGLAYSIRAIHRLLRKKPNLDMEYNIIGEGPLEKDLSELIQELKLSKIVHLCGSKNQDQIAKALQQSDIFILPSIAEALPVSLMEAQAVGLPAIATSVGSVNEIILDGKSGFCVPPRDVDALASKLNNLIDHPELWPEMGKIGRNHVENNYDINKLNDRLVEIYRQIIK